MAWKKSAAQLDREIAGKPCGMQIASLSAASIATSGRGHDHGRREVAAVKR